IPSSIPALVMMTNDWNNRIRKVDAAENLSTDDRMDLCFFEFSRGQHAGFVQDVIWHRELSDIVKQRPGSQRGEFRVRYAQQFAQTFCIDLHAPNVTMCRLILGVDSGGQGFYGRQVQ